MSTLEIERKFILAALPDDLQQRPHKAIQQGYITTDSANEIRLRSKGSNHYLTVKQGSGLARTEVEIEISRDQFAALWVLTEHKRVEKTRYDYQNGKFLYEIDIYQGELQPLQIVEVEFTSREDSQDFIPPEFFGLEVTEDKAYKNAALALHGVPESWQSQTIAPKSPYFLNHP